MRKLFLFIFAACLLLVGAWADTSVTETFSGALPAFGTGVSDGSFNSDLCAWDFFQVRRSSDDVNNTKQYNFLRYNKTDSKRSYIATTNLEGGVKAVSFHYYRYGSETGENKNRTLKLKVYAGENSNEVSHAGNNLKNANGSSGTDNGNYNHTFSCKTNGQLKIENTSTATGSADGIDNTCRIEVGNITITPYIFYQKKSVSIRIDGGTYKNSLINNTAGETGSLTFISSNPEIATVDASGNVIPVALGITTITARYEWSETEFVTASYKLNVDQPITETFSGVPYFNECSSEVQSVTGSICDWEFMNLRRKNQDDDKLKSGAQAWWTSGSTSPNFLRTKGELEGGVKAFAFQYRQSNTAKGASVKMDVTIGGTTRRVINYTVADDKDGDQSDKNYSEPDWYIKNNAQICFQNLSTTKNKAGRLLIGNITITPYIFYQKKSVSVALDSGAYTHTLIDNTAGESGTLTFTSSNTAVATVNTVGAVTPVGIGVTTIEAKYDWGDGNYVTTTYQLHVVRATSYVEDYSKATHHGYKNETQIYEYTGNYNTLWKYRKIGTSADRQVDGEQAFYMSRFGSDGDESDLKGRSCFFEAPAVEGGVKTFSCKWQQVATEDDGIYFWVKLKIGDSHVGNIHKGNGGADYRNNPHTCTKQVENKTNVKVSIVNESQQTSENTTAKKGRILIGPITITPYLFYFDKEATIAIGDSYIHPLLDNMDGEGSVTYSLVDPSVEGVASINASTGEVTALHGGDVTVKATWSEGAYTTYTLHVAYNLEEEADNSGTISSLNAQKVSVRLKDRTIRTGGYNTLCLPFDLDAAQLAASPLAGATVFEFSNAYLGEDNLDIRFAPTDHIEAGKPYLATVDADIAQPVFCGVTISNATPQRLEGSSLDFVGTFDPIIPLPETALYIVQDELHRNTASVGINAFRAYFDVPAGAPALAPSVRMRIVTHQDQATGMDEIINRQSSNRKCIKDGQLIIIREGVEYNAQGARIR